MRHLDNNPICWIAVLLAGLLGGCGGDVPPGGKAAVGLATIQGKVISDEGPITSGAVKVTDARGQTLTTAQIGKDSRFRIQVPSGAAYPVVLSVDMGEGKMLEAAITSSLAVEQDITPYSDLVVKSARSLGGVTPENIARAAGGAIGQRGQRAAGFAAESPTPTSGPRLKHASGGGHGH
ncbi:MAG: hypothetical protein N3A55_09915 [Methylohalobius sp.]|nr:hypothetical protein [Methylohalobius sp.]